MGDLPRLNPSQQTAFSFQIRPSWKDHSFQGRPVLAAVEAMQILAVQARQADPSINVLRMSRARFAKFLEIDFEVGTIAAWCDLAACPDGGMRAGLVTKTKARSAAMTRSVEHAQVQFDAKGSFEPALPLDLAAGLQDVCRTIDTDRIYSSLVPFGPRFRTLCRPLVLSRDGALAEILAPNEPIDELGPLGSSFPLDGAFHAACVWGQCFAGIVAFPVGFDQRIIVKPTVADRRYLARIVPQDGTSQPLIFDIWLLDEEGQVCEAALGVQMRDVSRGLWKPPSWVSQPLPWSLADHWADDCLGLVLMERSAVLPVAAKSLTPAEASRMAGMGLKRRAGYLSARLASKRLWRKLADNDRHTPGQSIETILADRPHPNLPPIDGQPTSHCSVSHDDRFTIAVAGANPIGVDVEKITPRALRAAGLFLSSAEQALLGRTSLDKQEAAVRMWSIKECTAKALDIPMAEAWRRIEIVGLENDTSRFEYGGGPQAQAVHASIEGHLFTLVPRLT